MLHIFPRRFRGGLLLTLLLLHIAWIVGVSSAPRAPKQNNDNNATHKKSVISINAANGAVDWGLVEAAAPGATNSSSLSWFVDEIVLDGFGQIMKEQSFQSALEHFEPQLRSIFSSGGDDASQNPLDALIVSSKGVNVLTYLASEGLWRGPFVLLSPIPNACDHIDGNSWETEWKSTIDTLVSHHTGHLVIGVGTSFDEQYLIVEMAEETRVCGQHVVLKELRTTAAGGGSFEKCPTWFLQSFPGDHSWKNSAESAPNIAMLINRVFGMSNNVVQELFEQVDKDL
jgi:hypothetical protein